jgi:hypothetical protein
VNIFKEISAEQMGKILNSLYILIAAFNVINKIILEYDYTAINTILCIISVKGVKLTYEFVVCDSV